LKNLLRLLPVLLLCASGAGEGVRAQERTLSTPDAGSHADASILALITAIEQTVRAGDTVAYLALHTESANRERTRAFAASELVPGATRGVVRERDREALPGTLPGDGYRLIVDVFAEFGQRARAATWRLDIKRIADEGASREWAIVEEEEVSSVENLYRLGVNPAKRFVARNLKISAEDVDLTLPEGSVYIAEIDQGTTALVLVGDGMLNFHPTPETEKGQVKIFCGAEVLATKFEAAYIRVNPYDVASLIEPSQLIAAPPDARELRRAQEIFREDSQNSFQIDLGDLSRDSWSLLPGSGDFVAEIRTRRYSTLTYAKAGNEAEDISFFDRKRHKNISLYPSKQKLQTRGRFYNEDDLVDYDIQNYDIEAAVYPDRLWIEGRARLRLKVRAQLLGTLTFKLADSLTVKSIVSNEYGRLFGIRVKNQNTLVVNLPTLVARDSPLTITVEYGGRLPPQTPDRETLTLEQGRGDDIPIQLTPEASFLYSNRSYWYPQAQVSDYATARIQLTVPSSIECVASGQLEPGFPGLLAGKDPSQNRKVYVFAASQPIRYLSFVLSRFNRAEATTVAYGPARAEMAVSGVALSGLSYRSLSVSVEANPRQLGRGRELAERSANIATFYESLVGDSPYPSFTIALIENDLPGGHSPGYFAALNQPLPTSNLTWRNDPAAFQGYNDFFLAHELAHQWWGQAVGWRNYHEQWLSEGFAQYFAALYAQHQRGDELFESVLRQLARWGMSESKQGPIYLGYRLGHIRGESKVFRALVYNKGAAVLHMLRRFLGDDDFFRGIRRFYRTARFHKAGTEDLRAAMEQESGKPLERFFERWIYGSTLPKIKLSSRVENHNVVLTVEQIGEIFDVPVTVTLQYADRKPVDVVIPVSEQVVEKRVPLAGVFRGAEFNRNDATLAEIVKQ
jgi:Peptidase family M1 domain